MSDLGSLLFTLLLVIGGFLLILRPIIRSVTIGAWDIFSPRLPKS